MTNIMQKVLSIIDTAYHDDVIFITNLLKIQF